MHSDAGLPSAVLANVMACFIRPEFFCQTS